MPPENYELYRALYELTLHQSWRGWKYRDTANIAGFGRVELASTIEDCRRKNQCYDGEYAQGSTAPAGLVFKVTYPDGEIRYFQKDGAYDSYGEVDYDSGSFFELRAVEKTVIAYERVDGGRKA